MQAEIPNNDKGCPAHRGTPYGIICILCIFAFGCNKKEKIAHNENIVTPIQSESDLPLSGEKPEELTNRSSSKQIGDNLVSEIDLFVKEIHNPVTFEAYFLDRLYENEQEILEILSLITEDIDYSLIQSVLVQFYSETGIERGMDSLSILNNNPSLSSTLINQLLSLYSEKEPGKALGWIIENSQLHGIENAASELGGQHGKTDDALRVFNQIIEGDLPDKLKEPYLWGLTKEWVQSDFNSVFEHLSFQKSTPVTDRTFYHLIGEGAKIDPATTMGWSSSINNQDLRRSAIIETALAWQAHDNDAYLTWKFTTTLPEDIFAELP